VQALADRLPITRLAKVPRVGSQTSTLAEATEHFREHVYALLLGYLGRTSSRPRKPSPRKPSSA
jgi:hypothetical protein